MQLTQAIIDEILDKASIVDVVGDYVSLEKKGRNFVGLCPFHADSNPSMSVSEEKHIYKCFSCGAGGNAIKFVQDFEKISFPEAAKKVASRVGMTLEFKQNPNEKYYRLNQAATAFYKVYLLNTPEGKDALQYLASRGISNSTIQEFDLGYAPNKHVLYEAMRKRQFEPLDLITSGLVSKQDEEYRDVFRGRVLFPIKDHHGNIVGFSGRSMRKDAQAKYMNTAESSLFQKAKILYHLDVAKQHVKIKKRIVLMEGYMDVIAASNAGIKEAVATMGTALTKEHVSLLKSITNRIVLSFDGDNAGIEAAFKSLKALKGFDVGIVVLKDKLDPDEYIKKYGAQEFHKELDSPMDPIRFLYMYHLERTDQSNIQELERFKSDVFLSLDGASNVQKELYFQELSQTLKVNLESIKNDYYLRQNKTKPKAKTKEVTRKHQKYERAELMLIAELLLDKEKALMLDRKLEALDIFVSEDNLHLREAIMKYYKTHTTILEEEFIQTLSEHMQMYYRGNIHLTKPLNERAINDCLNALQNFNTLSKLSYIQDHPSTEGERTKEELDAIIKMQRMAKTKKGTKPNE